MTCDEQTIAVYEEKAVAYSKLFKAAKTDPVLLRFIARLPAGGAVLDLGCGSGDYANALHETGFKVTATDASPAMVSLAGQYAGINVRQSGFDDLTEIGIYDGVWANFSLLHASRREFPNHLQRIFQALKPEGAFHIAMKLGTGQARDALGRFYSYYSAEELKTFLFQAGFMTVDEINGEGAGLAGTVDPWVALTATAKQP